MPTALEIVGLLVFFFLGGITPASIPDKLMTAAHNSDSTAELEHPSDALQAKQRSIFRSTVQNKYNLFPNIIPLS